MILTGREIDAHVGVDIHITPYNPKNLQPNSYDLTLSNVIKCYTIPGKYAITRWWQQLFHSVIDPQKEQSLWNMTIPETGLIIYPGFLYLGSTVERTWIKNHASRVEGRSSIGRLGISVHQTAGYGDHGFDGNWTLEITCIHPVILYPNMRIGQIVFEEITGERTPYKGRYQNQTEPTESKFNL